MANLYLYVKLITASFSMHKDNTNFVIAIASRFSLRAKR